MAYPTNSLAKVQSEIDRQMIAIKTQATQHKAALSGSVYATRIIDAAINLKRAKEALQSDASTPGLAQYAKDQKNDQNLDVVAEFQAVIAATDGIVDNFPKDGSGYLLRETWGASGPIQRGSNLGAWPETGRIDCEH